MSHQPTRIHTTRAKAKDCYYNNYANHNNAICNPKAKSTSKRVIKYPQI